MSDYQRVFTDSLFDQLARLDDLYARAERRATQGLRPILANLRQACYQLAGVLLAPALTSADLLRVTAALTDLHLQLDLLPGMSAPIECEYLLSDLMGLSPEGETPPPVVPSFLPQVATRVFGRDLVSIHLPLAYRESPLYWTLLAGELGLWLTMRSGLIERLGEGQSLAPEIAGWLARFAADLFAVRLAGPAYAAALAVRLPQAWVGGEAKGEPPIALRSERLFLALKDRGFDVSWQPAQPTGKSALPEGLAPLLERAASLIWEEPHLPSYEATATATATALVADLRDGLPISAAPRATQAEQQACLARFQAQSGEPAPGSAAELLAMLADRPNAAAVILNAGWSYRWEVGTEWLDGVRGLPPAEALARYRQPAYHLDQLLEKSIETAALHRLLQEAP